MDPHFNHQSWYNLWRGSFTQWVTQSIKNTHALINKTVLLVYNSKYKGTIH